MGVGDTEFWTFRAGEPCICHREKRPCLKQGKHLAMSSDLHMYTMTYMYPHWHTHMYMSDMYRPEIPFKVETISHALETLAKRIKHK